MYCTCVAIVRVSIVHVSIIRVWLLYVCVVVCVAVAHVYSVCVSFGHFYPECQADQQILKLLFFFLSLVHLCLHEAAFEADSV